MMRKKMLGLVVASLLLDVVPALGQTDPTPPPATFQLRPGDVVAVRIWREPDLSGEFPVHEDGQAILPRLGPWPVAGISLPQLKQELLEEYARILRNPSIEISVLWRVKIFGAVGKPGILTLDPTMTLTDAIAMAGGPMGDADRRKIVLTRGNSVTKIKLDRVYTISDLAIQSGDEIYVPPKNWFVRNWYTALSSATLAVSLWLTLSR